VARHPVAAFLVMAYTITLAFALPPIRTRLDILPPELPFWDVLATIFGVGLPAFLVVAAAEGRTGVGDLARRCLRWRVGARWYFAALLGVPIAALLIAGVIFGRELLNTLAEKWPLLFTLVLPRFLIRVVLFQFFEEAGWMGFLQARLQDSYGPLKAVILAEIPFALWHLPSVMVEQGLGLAQLPLALGLLGILAIFQLFGRVVIMWLYNNTHRSVLLVVLFHSSHNITTGELGREFIPGWSDGSALLIASGVVAVTAVLIVVFTKGRLSYRPNHASQTAEAPLTKE
jgi:membrane protease YdiL (CAAX protease family)